MKIRLFFLFASVFILFLSCNSGPAVTGDNAFLLQSLDDANKSIALTNQGEAAYNTYIVQQSDYSKTDYIRQFFVVALRYDPENAKAKQNLDKVDAAKSLLLDSRLKTAVALGAKPNRKEAENYAFITSLQGVVAIDPKNETAVKMLKDNAALQVSLADGYLKRGTETKMKADDKATAAQDRETLYLSALDDASKAAAVSVAGSKSMSQAQSLKSGLAVDLGKSFDSRAATEAKLLQAAKYEEAKAELGRMSFLSVKMDGARGAEVNNATYALYFQWAKALDAKGQVADAQDKVDQALAAKRGTEALELKKKISAKAASSNQDAAFDAALPEIDKAIAKGDFLAATRRIDSTSKLSKDKAKQDQLESRRAKMRDAVGGLYEAGVAAYRAEDFKTAIDKLSSVVGFKADYEQAADYLAKAKEKQKLLDQFSN
jgi:hypothetical protein